MIQNLFVSTFVNPAGLGFDCHVKVVESGSRRPEKLICPAVERMQGGRLDETQIRLLVALLSRT